MQIKIEYAPRENAYVWGIINHGHPIHWHKGRTTVGATQDQVLEIHPDCEFTVS